MISWYWFGGYNKGGWECVTPILHNKRLKINLKTHRDPYQAWYE